MELQQRLLRLQLLQESPRLAPDVRRQLIERELRLISRVVQKRFSTTVHKSCSRRPIGSSNTLIAED